MPNANSTPPAEKHSSSKLCGASNSPVLAKVALFPGFNPCPKNNDFKSKVKRGFLTFDFYF